MKIFDLFSESDFNQQLADKMVKIQHHPSAPLAIANYTQVAAFTPEKWNHVTDICRGLIYNTDTLAVVARPFKKFWNYGDSRHPETMPENLPTGPPELTKKEDGSLGIIFKNPVNGRFEVASRGSFTSDQAKWATQWLENKQKWPTTVTPLVEIIYPANRIVVDYKGWCGLRLLAGVEIETGDEIPRWALAWMAGDNNLEPVPLCDLSIADAVEQDIDGEEGYVATWRIVGQPPLRVKIKFDTYCKLHKVLTQTSAIGIWELLRDGKDTATLFENTPVEFQNWASGVELSLRKQFDDIRWCAANDLYEGPVRQRELTREDRKAWAEYAKTTPYPQLIFAQLDDKDLTPMIWKMLRPAGDIRPFRSDE